MSPHTKLLTLWLLDPWKMTALLLSSASHYENTQVVSDSSYNRIFYSRLSVTVQSTAKQCFPLWETNNHQWNFGTNTHTIQHTAGSSLRLLRQTHKERTKARQKGCIKYCHQVKTSQILYFSTLTISSAKITSNFKQGSFSCFQKRWHCVSKEKTKGREWATLAFRNHIYVPKNCFTKIF